MVPSSIIWIITGTFLVSVLGTVAGFGISTTLIPIMLLFFPVPQTLVVVGVVHWFNDIWKLTLFREGIRWDLILYFGLTGSVLSFTGAKLSLSVPQTLLSRVIGGLILSYVIFLYLKPEFKVREGKKNALLGGGLYGLSAGLSGIGGAIRTAFLSGFDLKKKVFIATAGAISLIIDTTRITTYILGGTRLEPSLMWGMLGFIPASLLGAYTAKHLIVKKIPQQKFRPVIAVFLAAAALKLLLFP